MASRSALRRRAAITFCVAGLTPASRWRSVPGIMRGSPHRFALALALFALWAQSLWPALSLAAVPGKLAVCAGYGLQYVADPTAPPAAAATHDCPCCILQPAPMAVPPAWLALPLPWPPGIAAYAEPDVSSPAEPGYRLPWGRAPPAA